MTDIDQDTRLSIIREICRKEGHGELVDITSFPDHPRYRRRLLCQRGCGITIIELVEAMTLDELSSYLEQKKLSGTVWLRGTIEVER